MATTTRPRGALRSSTGVLPRSASRGQALRSPDHGCSGAHLAEPVPGCIAVLSREDPDSWKGHVGFFLRADAKHVYLLGGNQLGEVREHFYPSASVLGFRWPSHGTVDGAAVARSWSFTTQ